MNEKYSFGGHEFPVAEQIQIPETQITVPVLDIPLMSDDRWQKKAMEARREHPEYYAEYEKENVGWRFLTK